MKQLQLLAQLFSLLSGSLIYLCFRSSNLLMFKWIEWLNLNNALEKMRVFAQQNIKIENDWILYSLPDGLWMFSLTTNLLYVWGNTVNQLNFKWIVIMPILAILSEFSQKYTIIAGTYDSNDLLAYFLGFTFPLIFFSNHIQIINNKFK